MHHKRGRPKNRRAGCQLCKPHKSNAFKGAQTARTAFAALVAHEDRLLARLDPSERAALRTLLTKIWQQS